MKLTKNKIISVAVSAVLCGALIAGNVIAVGSAGVVNDFLDGGASEGDVGSKASKELAAGDALCTEIEEDSITLFKNNGVLPLQAGSGVSVFGYGGTYEGFLLKGQGSGSSTINGKKEIRLLDALRGTVRTYDAYNLDAPFNEFNVEKDQLDDPKFAGISEALQTWGQENLSSFNVNEDLVDKYAAWVKSNKSKLRTYALGGGFTNIYNLDEPSSSVITDADLDNALTNYGETALFVISRCGGENVGEIPEGYLDISTKERDMITRLKNKGFKVVVILNTTNTMHLGFLEELQVDACISVGITGQSGARAISKVLDGTITPSGRFTDIVTVSGNMAKTYDPSYNNHAASNSYITYAEDIYYGYKWYETADVEGFFADKSLTYDDVVAYPFGFGLSYTKFEQKIKAVQYKDDKGNMVDMPADFDISKLDMNQEIAVTVEVKNTGNKSGKDVVQLYYTPEYTPGGIEKAAINLLAFGKTETLKPYSESKEEGMQDVTVTFTPYQLASYDAYDKNENGFKGYELEKGNYAIRLMQNSHEEIESRNYKVNTAIKIENDPATGKPVSNHFTGENAYAGLGSDGAEAGVPQNWLSRKNFAETYPYQRSKNATNSAKVKAAAEYLNNAPYEEAAAAGVTTGADNGLYLWTENGNKPSKKVLTEGSESLKRNEALMTELAAQYDSDKWKNLLDQLTAAEMKVLVEFGGFRREATSTVGLRQLYDYDGPAGFNTNSRNGSASGEWTAYTSEALMGCSWNARLMFSLGRSMGAEANATGIHGWYAPGVNLHRSNYNARNFEYYSEDGTLSGKLAIQVIAGAKTNGLVCYLKHFACSEEGPNPGGVNTWITEQNLRENYLKPFEIAAKGTTVEFLKEDKNEETGEMKTETQTMFVKANAIMTAFNRVGASWAGANYAMNVQVLRNEWGFQGALITDWTSGRQSLGGMNVQQGIRSGNDLWLDPNENPRSMDTKNNIDVYCARNAVHNILYMTCDAFTTYDQVQAKAKEGFTLDSYQTSLGDSFKVVPDRLTPILVVLDIVIIGGLAAWIVLAWLPRKKKNVTIEEVPQEPIESANSNEPNDGDEGKSE